MMTEIHPGTPVDFDALSKTPPSRISDETLVASEQVATPKKTASVCSRITIATFLRSNAPPPLRPTIPAEDNFDLPELPYSLRTRKLALVIVWTIILLDSVVLPIGLFFILKYGAGWRDVKNLAISNGVFGFSALMQYALRMFRLLRPSPEYRPLGSGRWTLDFYQYQFTIGFIGITLILSFATGPENLRLISLAPSLLPAMCGPQFLISCLCYRLGWRIPVDFSSQPKGSIAPPAVFTVVEDVISVDGRGGLAFRAAWLRRYQVSERFRVMMWNLTMFWGCGCIVCVGVTAAVVFMLESKYVAFGFGWTAPFVWAGIWAGITTVWVQRMLVLERNEWKEMREMREMEQRGVGDNGMGFA